VVLHFARVSSNQQTIPELVQSESGERTSTDSIFSFFTPPTVGAGGVRIPGHWQVLVELVPVSSLAVSHTYATASAGEFQCSSAKAAGSPAAAGHPREFKRLRWPGPPADECNREITSVKQVNEPLPLMQQAAA